MGNRHALSCSQCHYRVICGPSEMLEQLRRIKKVRRDVEPDADVLAELLRACAPQLTCPQCGTCAMGVQLEPLEHDEDWGGTRPCQSCGRAIPRERLELLPAATLCVDCQRSDDRGDSTDPVDYCPKCGTPRTLRQTRVGLTRYQMICPRCRR
jgi:hypothetical protein